MPQPEFLRVTYSSSTVAGMVKAQEIDTSDHLASLRQSVLNMQADMNVFLTAEMQKEAGGKKVLVEPDVLAEID